MSSLINFVPVVFFPDEVETEDISGYAEAFYLRMRLNMKTHNTEKVLESPPLYQNFV